ncbi:Hypothetical Protein FCC1311_055522 [Hondaea fermentalgiana]|uniref:Uncharacterized protein n=1 Tax=Hondaea fermentalgiana TaxID=2315210 RepID=A0A2R5GEF3_9STRA|nr:Hypothetical Protein FCC1311_055522 [Hondaea fermentalgiana]|eukprot:GBG29330.1 Hypothetical Protein FCC1311_055522 [Hondaea fermentalgiana]
MMRSERQVSRLQRSLVADCIAIARTAIAIDRNDNYHRGWDRGLGLAHTNLEPRHEQVSRSFVRSASRRTRARRTRVEATDDEEDDAADDDEYNQFEVDGEPTLPRQRRSARRASYQIRRELGARHAIVFSDDDDEVEDGDDDVDMYEGDRRRQFHHHHHQYNHRHARHVMYDDDDSDNDEDDEEDGDEIGQVGREVNSSIRWHRSRHRRRHLSLTATSTSTSSRSPASRAFLVDKYRGVISSHNRRSRRRTSTQDPAIEMERRRRRRAQRRLFQGTKQTQGRTRFSSIGSMSPGASIGFRGLPATIARFANAANTVNSASPAASRGNVSSGRLAGMVSPAAVGPAAFYSPGIVRVRREPEPVKPKRNPRDLDALRHEMVKTPERPTSASPVVPSYDAEAEDASAESEADTPALHRHSSSSSSSSSSTRHRTSVDATPVTSPLVMTPQRGLHT